MRRTIAIIVFFCVLLLAFGTTGCASNDSVQRGENFLGNYPPQKIKTEMFNSLNEKSLALDPVEVSFIFYPKKNIVEMKLFYQFNQLVVTLTRQNRDEFLSAMQKYIDSYQSGNLIAQDSSIKSYFGTTKTDFLWGTLTPVYYARPDLRFEFRYVTPKKPYFLIKNDMFPQLDQNGNTVKDSVASTPTLKIALTPLQCKDLIETLNQDALKKIVADLDTKQAQFDIPAEPTGDSKGNEMF